ncbi:hypothetical protein NW768_008082 [Fusarium equiseti]|uniref:Uncharacterized protein n=1 Tax=Fusarium equiseti TaxID=61235 RepID=A0ABQ8R646_FUSEQ|nr:hypothetical protein NW768_008082 [Fusarium equiseti]
MSQSAVMSLSGQNSPTNDQMIGSAIYYSEPRFLVRFLESISDNTVTYHLGYPFCNGVRDEPRTNQEVMKIILYDNRGVYGKSIVNSLESFYFHCFRPLNGLIKLGLQPRHDTFKLRSKDARRMVQTGFVKFLEHVYRSGDICKEHAVLSTFEWFIELDENVHGRSVSDLHGIEFRSTRPSDLRPPIDHLCEMLNQENIVRLCHHRKDTTDIICEMIEKLCAKGAIIDLYQDRFFRPKFLQRSKNAVEIAMTPHCPVYFLEIFLSNRTHEDDNFTAESPAWKPSGAKVQRGMHYATTDMRWVIQSVYNAFFTMDWSQGGKFDFARDFGAKANLLRSVKYTDSTEIKVLDNLVDTLSSIQSNFDSLRKKKGFRAELERRIWFALCRAVAPLADTGYNAQYEEHSKYSGHRRHRFIVDPSWDPRDQWLEKELDKHIPLRTDRERYLPEHCTSLARVMRDDLKKVWQQVMLDRSGGRAWWEIEDQNEWYITADDVQQALEDRPLEGIAMIGL